MSWGNLFPQVNLMINLEKFLALVILIICIIYAYTSFIIMQANLLPFEKNMTVLPNSLPKVISILGIIISTFLLLNTSAILKSEEDDTKINLTNIFNYYYGKAIGIIVLMIVYSLSLRPLGFIFSSILFLFLSSLILGEKSYIKLILICFFGSTIIWFLIEKILGIYMRPFPIFFQVIGF